jgi:hypothetical protein
MKPALTAMLGLYTLFWSWCAVSAVRMQLPNHPDEAVVYGGLYGTLALVTVGAVVLVARESWRGTLVVGGLTGAVGTLVGFPSVLLVLAMRTDTTDGAVFIGLFGTAFAAVHLGMAALAWRLQQRFRLDAALAETVAP